MAEKVTQKLSRKWHSIDFAKLAVDQERSLYARKIVTTCNFHV